MVKHKMCFIDGLSVETYKKTYAAMHPLRQAKIDRLRQSDDKKRSLAGEYLARMLLSEETGINFDDIVIVADELGKPYSPNAGFEFSISHSDNLAVAAVSENKIGIDVEKYHRVYPRIFKKVCTDRELEYLFEKKPVADDFKKEISDTELCRFFEIWTIKEAYFKCIGTGITDFKSIDIFSDSIETRNLSQGDYFIHTVTLK